MAGIDYPRLKDEFTLLQKDIPDVEDIKALGNKDIVRSLTTRFLWNEFVINEVDKQLEKIQEETEALKAANKALTEITLAQDKELKGLRVLLNNAEYQIAALSRPLWKKLLWLK